MNYTLNLKSTAILIGFFLIYNSMLSQTFSWVGFTTTTNSATRTFTNGNMTAAVTATSGGGTTGYSYGSSSQIGDVWSVK
jgi:hypothetical protein